MSYPPGFTARAVWSSSILVADSHFLSEHIVIVAIIVVDSRFLALWLPELSVIWPPGFITLWPTLHICTKRVREIKVNTYLGHALS